jgi:ribosome-associated protein
VSRDELRWAFSRSSGPGGQNVNKVNTRAELRVRPESIRGLDEGAMTRLRSLATRRLDAEGDIVVTRDESRSQLDNREGCIDVIKSLVAQARVVPRRRRKTKPSRGSQERRLDGKRREGDKKRRRRWEGD